MEWGVGGCGGEDGAAKAEVGMCESLLEWRNCGVE